MMKKIISILIPIVWFFIFIWFSDVEIKRNVEGGVVLFLLIPSLGVLGFICGGIFDLYEIKRLK